MNMPKLLDPDRKIDEECIPDYDPAHFYHARPGETLDDRFELVVKIGWGSSSTVWLARNITCDSMSYVTIKITTCNAQDSAGAQHELSVLNHIDRSGAGETGRRFVRTVQDSFEISVSNKTHVCLVFEPLREPIWLLRRRLGADNVSRDYLVFFKMYIMVLLDGLNFLHTKCNIIHTDLKLDNILVTFEDDSVIDAFISSQMGEPMVKKELDHHSVYLSHNNFGNLRIVDDTPALLLIHPKITDFGLAQRGDTPGKHIHPIQPDHYHAPEVILGTGWSYSADIWNFAVMIWELLTGNSLFQRLNDAAGLYSPSHHLADMIALLGPIPPELIKQERTARKWSWNPSIYNPKGKLCNNVADFYGGPFFDVEGNFISSHLNPGDRRLADIIPECIPKEEAGLFIDFMCKMLCWLPEKRATARELQQHAWLDITKG